MGRSNQVVNAESTRRNVRPGSRAEAERRNRILQQRELRKKKKRMKNLLGAIKLVVLFAAAIGCGKYLLSQRASAKAKAPIPKEYTNVISNDVVEGNYVANNIANNAANNVVSNEIILDDKRILEDIEVEDKLKELALENKDIAQIYVDRKKYPEELLKALSNNEEMTPFVVDYLNSDGTVTGGFGEEEMEEDFPLFLQWDKRWGYAPYGSSNIGISGCGPTCLSMVIVALTGNEDATPDKLADFSMDNGHYEKGHGTAWTLMTAVNSTYGVNGFEIGLEEEAMKYNLDMGHPIICVVRPGDFTAVGHFIVIYDYDEEGFIVNDPNNVERSQMRWTFKTLQYQIRNLWAYAKK